MGWFLVSPWGRTLAAVGAALVALCVLLVAATTRGAKRERDRQAAERGRDYFKTRRRQDEATVPAGGNALDDWLRERAKRR